MQNKIAASLFLALPCIAFPASQTFISQGPGPSTDTFWGAGNTDVGTATPIAISPTSSTTLFAGGCNGGIWKTTNMGTTWTPLTDHKNSLSISAIAFNPTDGTSNTLIAGTGTTSNGAVGVQGDFFRGGPSIGVYYTTDGGANWSEPAGNTSLTETISGVAAQGSGATATFLVSTFEFTNPSFIGAGNGLFKSTNTGASFTKITLPGVTANSGVSSLTPDPTNNANFWAAVSDSSTFVNTRLLASTDTGTTWSPIFTSTNSAGLIQNTTQTVIKAVRGPSNTLALLISNALSDVTAEKIQGVFWSGDNGVTWKQLFNLATASIDFNPLGQGVVNSQIVIDPTNSNIVYVTGSFDNTTGGLSAYYFDATQAINTPTSFINGTGPSLGHPDVRTTIFDGASTMLVSTDGGIYTKAIGNPPPNNGAWTTINGNLSLMQNYANTFDFNNDVIVTASQDTGVQIQNTPNNPLSHNVLGGDGVNARVNDKSSATTSYYYGSTQFLGEFTRFANTGGTITNASLTLTGGDPGFSGNFLSQVVLNQIDPQKIAVCGSTFSSDTGTPQYAVSVFTDDLTSTSFLLTALAGALPSGTNGVLIEAMSYGTQTNNNALLAGLSEISLAGQDTLWLTSDASATGLAAVTAFTTASGFPVVDTVFDTRTIARFFVIDSNNETLWYTTNTGTSFTNITSSLPSNLTGTNSHRLSLEFLSTNGVNAIFVGGLSNNGAMSSLAVATSDSTGTLSTFNLFGLGLPNTMLNVLSFNNQSDTLLASAYGRGAWLMYDVTSNFAQATVLQFGLANNDSTPDTSILNNGTSANRPLIKYGTGTLTISGAASYTGATTINKGTMALSGSGSISTSSSLTLNDSSIFDISQVTTSTTVSSLSGAASTTVNLGSKLLDIGSSASSTFSGVIQDGGLGGGSGGRITKIGTGTLTLQGMSTYTGVTTISAGTIALSMSGSIADSSGVSITAGAFDISQTTSGATIKDLTGSMGTFVSLGSQTLTLGTANSTTYPGMIQNGGIGGGSGGQIIKQGAGTFSVTAVNTYTGGTTINGGTFQITMGGNVSPSSFVNVNASGTTFDIQTATNPVTIGDLSSASSSTVAVGNNSLTFGTGNSTTFAGSFTGTGTLIKQGSGTFNLTGVNAFTGTFDVNAGTLHVATSGVLAPSSITNIAAGATLSGTGTLGTVNLDGTVSPGDSIGTIHPGNFSYNSGSDYLVELSNTASDLVASTGTVTINPGATLVLAQSGVLSMPKSSYTIITSANTIVQNGTFTLDNPFTRFTFSVKYDPNDVMLILTSITNFIASGNAGKVVKCFNLFLDNPPSDLDPIIGILNMQTPAQWQKSFNQMQPANFNNIAFAQENVAERIRQVFSAHLFEQRVESCPNNQKWRLWVAPFLEHVHQRGEGNNKGYKETFRGFTAAADYQTQKHWTLTGGFSYADSDVGIVHGKADGDFKTYAGSLAAIWAGPHLFADGLFSYLFSSIDGKRRMHFSTPVLSPISRTARHHQDSDQYMGHFGLGCDFKWKAGEKGTVRFYPFADVDYIYVKQDGYKEHGAGSLDLKVNGKRYDLLRPEGGVGFGYAGCFKNVNVNFDVTASYIREERYLGQSTKAKFEHVPCSFTVKGFKPDNNLYSPSARLTFASTSQTALSLSLGYHGEFGEHFVENAGEAELKVAF